MTQPIAVALKDAPTLVPFSEAYLRRAVHRTTGNPLKARKAGGKYIVTVAALTEWMEREGDEA